MRNLLYITVFYIFLSCGKRDEIKKHLDNCPQIAQHVLTPDKDSITICKLGLITKDTIDFPISELLSDFQIIRLDNLEEALMSHDGRISVSDHYVSIYSTKSGGYKLFITFEGRVFDH